MHEAVKSVASFIAVIAEGVAVVIILSGMAGALWVYLKKTMLLKSGYEAATESRRRLGHSLSLGLEFLIGADILKTAISPTWQDIGQLGAIVGIRTVLNFFLQRELREGDGGRL
jgi:uncharacterized membrane protein